MNGKILITASTGNVGRPLVQQLAKAGHAVKGATRDPDRAGRPAGVPVELVRFDFADPATYEEAFAGVDRLFLLTPTEQPDMLGLVTPAIDRAARAGVRRIVNMSYMGVEQAEHDAFGLIERHLDGAGIPWTSIRPNWFMQNFVTWDLDGIRDHGGIFAPAEDARTSFVDTRDIAAVAAASLTEDGHEGRAYTVTGPEPLTHAEVADHISRAAGRPIRYMALSDDEFAEALVPMGLQPHMAEMFRAIYGAMRGGLNEPVTDDVQRVTGRGPIPFAQFALEHAGCWR